ncbi:MAG: glycosyltransferase [Microcoleus sp. PH2017_10_PVI_O_A]|uniref:glycosyltransferase n=1 Tax=unclassified Microcoleus TaxID=2642155 RepID=UPI001DBF9745|nr:MULTISPECIES: glycosyltransferase [unclassified Microcoleus]TAE80743.1 MAG: glycosyltransferase family 1 protein [Oscillatoriales cyanobacterium]MCC3407418.1 glycosyltransferase [Microcoleus sp. PH2017_10_PVI_O_A]MCC3461498.1 glycosyltransferase [Microcoleus sp. PH2017_11_PCY_U_A]MCC3479972.1 glycosyltransferase [Microcoleus sp. PH2017_12_PCY_D_A]MCC3529778.1 glycosyltransferase [Microcoleus sp. PH2017_21_RUC_O_A]
MNYSINSNSLNTREDGIKELPLTPIDQRYLLVINIQSSCDSQGSRYLDPMWAKDLIEHFKYLKNFTLAAPQRLEIPPENTIKVDSETSFADAKFIDLPSPNSYAQAILMLPATVAQLWGAIARTDIVHSAVAGWPIPMGWLVTPIAIIQRKKHAIVVESAPWRLQPGTTPNIKARIIAQIYERLNRWCINRADLTIFTQAEYQESLLTKKHKKSYIINASWIDKENIISEAGATQIWQEKRSQSPQKIKFLFAGRLHPSKGVLILLEAMKILDNENMTVELDILGEGELLSNCKAASNQMQKSAKINILGTIPYGPKFFDLLQQYHAIVVPSISDEQPRIVYDAYSQALPVLANNTAGLRDCIENGITGSIANCNDPIALANFLKQSAENLNLLQNMGIAALKKAHSLTHQEIHRQRWQLLLKMLDESKN